MWDYEIVFTNGEMRWLKTDRITEVWALIQRVCIEQDTVLMSLRLR